MQVYLCPEENQLEQEALNHLDILVIELSKSKPNEKVIKKAMVQLGISYSNDPIDRISQIVLALHPSPSKEIPS
jgi:hypothetical protein